MSIIKSFDLVVVRRSQGDESLEDHLGRERGMGALSLGNPVVVTKARAIASDEPPCRICGK